ncbi:hypothetical protein KPH14_004751 [Odynerus spinipes]|uniref:Uncharacterized protein n=1 Tax=Odynerus spinipes TaxID=1348599 RepID=A0AAD9RNK9_9HYME|nr:hypothetical protein KPH14_004751 [Odynerus spinipes]
MSLCFRTVSNKFTSFVNTRKQITKIDYQLPKNVKSSSFLDEFLGLQTSIDTKANLSERNLDVFTDAYQLYQNRLPIPVKSHMRLERTLVKDYVKDKNNILHTEQQSLTNHYRLKNVEPTSVTNLLLYNITVECREKEDKFSTRNITFIANKKNTTSLTYGVINVQEDSDKQSAPKDEDRPSREQLEHVFQCLSRDLPRFFIQSLDYSIYSPDIILINNIKGTTTRGIFGYVKQAALLRTLGHIKFAYITLDILKITIDPEDDSIKVRWRMRGISGMKVIFTFWKYKLWKMKETLANADVWYDGFSTYYVDANGKVYKHVVDKMMPDQDHLYEKEKTPVVTKLAMFVGLKDSQILSSNEFISKLKHAIMFNVK